ncbi:MAG: molybdopterin-dependent oxidoreductase, partial [Candidatus Baltobacteraceae bacterium]
FAALEREGRTLLTYISCEQVNARGAEAMGMLPFTGPGYHVADAGLDFDGICDAARAGKIEALAIFGANPVRNAADGARVRDALQAIPFLVVTELFMTETAQLASLVLPAAGAFEKSGSMVNLAGDVLPTAAALAPPDGVLGDFEIVAGLARALEIELPDTEEIERATIAAAAALPVGIAFGDDRFVGGAKNERSGEGLRLHVLHHAFDGGGTLAHDERLAALRPVPTAAFAPADADRLGIRAGDILDLVGPGGSVGDLCAVLRENLAPGNVALVGARFGATANGVAAEAQVRVENIRHADLPVEA